MPCLAPDLRYGLYRGDVGSWVRTAAMAAALAVLPLILAPSRIPSRQKSGSPPQARPHASCQISSSQPCSTTKQSSRDDDDAELQTRGTPASHASQPAALGGAKSPSTTKAQVHGRNGDSSLRQRQDGCEPPQAASGQQGQQYSVASGSTCNSSAEHAEACSAVAASLCKQAVERIARVREVRCDYGLRLALADTLVLACPKLVCNQQQIVLCQPPRCTHSGMPSDCMVAAINVRAIWEQQSQFRCFRQAEANLLPADTCACPGGHRMLVMVPGSCAHPQIQNRARQRLRVCHVAGVVTV